MINDLIEPNYEGINFHQVINHIPIEELKILC